jgi:uncharacterized protein
MLDYKELNNLLRMLQSDACAADFHGFLCGHICVNDFPTSGIWKDYLDIMSDDEVLMSDCHENINALVRQTIKLFESSEFDFQLLLPDDNTPIAERVSALGEWCHGFLNGFAMGKGIAQTLEDENNRELIENFTRICQLEVSDKSDESDEKALFELVEYVRMGAIFIYSQSNLYMPGVSGTGALH